MRALDSFVDRPAATTATWRSIVVYGLLGLGACGGVPPDEEEMADVGAEESGEPEWPSYAECPITGGNDCFGTDCTIDEEVRRWAELIQEEIDHRGWSDRLFLVHVESPPDTDQLVVIAVQEVDWFRARTSINGLRTGMSDEEFRQRVSQVFDAWGPFPDSLVPFESVEVAVEACHPDLRYHHCDNHAFGFIVRGWVSGEPKPNCVHFVHSVSIDLVTGEVNCLVEQPPPDDCE